MSKYEQFPSINVSRIIPQLYRLDNSLIIKFMTYYYEWLEEIGNPVYAIRSIPDNIDVDSVNDYFIGFLKNEFMRNIPENISVDPKFLIKHIKDFYKSKGSEDSFKILFRILFDEEITIYYPGNDILRVSDGRWVKEKYLTVKLLSEDDIDVDYIKGQISNASATVDYKRTIIESFISKRIYTISNIRGDFLLNELLVDQNGNTFATLITNIQETAGEYKGTYGFISSDKKIQDNNYYQEYSYEIQSTHDIQSYRQIVKDLVHPAGTFLFGAVFSTSDIGVQLTDIEVEKHVRFSTHLDLSSLTISTQLSSSTPDSYNSIHFYSDIPVFSTNMTNINYKGIGTVSTVPNQNIGAYSPQLISWYSPIQLGNMGADNIIIGNNSSFSVEFNSDYVIHISNNSIITTKRILDVINDNILLTSRDSKLQLYDMDYTVQPPNATISSEILKNGIISSTGTISVLSDDTINNLSSIKINDCSECKILDFSSNKVIIGISTEFLTSASIGDVLRVANTSHIISSVSSNNIMSVRDLIGETILNNNYSIIPIDLGMFGI